MARILVVEDDVVFATLVRRALTRAGHEMDHAPDAATAGQLVSDHDYDLVVMDLFLPDGDGLALCHQLRATHNVPVLMASSLEQDLGAGVVGTPLGPQAFMSKPFNFGEFAVKIEELLAAPPA